MPRKTDDDAPQMRFAQQLKKGVLEMLVLELLAQKPGHGYQLLLRLKESGLTLKEGTLYPILYRLEDEGCISSAWQAEGEGGPPSARPKPRKVYTVTDKGRRVLEAQWQTWRQFAGCVERFAHGRGAKDE